MSLLNVCKAVQVNTDEEYAIATEAYECGYSVAFSPKRDSKGNIVKEQFPFYIQMVYKPLCGNYVRCYYKFKHPYSLTFDEFIKEFK